MNVCMNCSWKNLNSCTHPFRARANLINSMAHLVAANIDQDPFMVLIVGADLS